MYIYLIVALITAIMVGWEYRKKSYLIFILGFLFCPIIILFHSAELVLGVVSYLKRKFKTDK
jgi:hypothetical protein